MLKNEALNGDGDERQIPFAPILSLVDLTIASNIIQKISVRDFSYAYSRSNLMIADESGMVKINVRILNLGDIASHLCYLWLVIWSNGNKLKVTRIKRPITIFPKAFVDFEHSLTLFELGVTNIDEIINIHAIVIDPLFDKLEIEVVDFIEMAKNNDYASALITNPCRYSRKVASLNLSTSPFQISDNQILHTKGYGDLILSDVDAGADASFGILNSSGVAIPVINNLKSQPRNTILNTFLLTRDKVVFYLGSTLGTKYSNNPAHCRISQVSDGIIFLEWEDGGDGDFNDYKLTIIHR